MAAAAILQFDPLDRSVTLQSVHSNDLLLSLTGAALWRMQLTFPYNTQLGAVPYRMVMKQCISSTFYSQFTGCFSLGISLLPVIRTT